VVLLNRSTPRNLFLFPPAVGFGVAYQGLANLLNDSSFYSFNFIENENRLKEYADIMTNLQPTGPYILFGWSAAGKLIFEVAGVLEQCGREVSDIILVDSLFSKNKIVDAQEYEEEKLKSMLEVEQYLGKMGIEFLKEKVRKKIEQYLNYFRNTVTFGVIHANVHLITSEDTQGNSEIDIRCWDEFTTKTVSIYNGFGSHGEMFAPGLLEKNAGIIRKILNLPSV
jgi:fengycin family lipopeptide synthetase D